MSDEITLRDTFAAAALTGWLASQQTVVSAAAMASHAYEYADAMLRQRALSLQSEAGEKPPRNGAVSSRETVTDHDAAPAARAAIAPGTGDTTREPVMYALQFNGDPLDPEFVFSSAEEAENFRQCTSSTTRVVRLYGDKPPTALTDAEREAVQWSIEVADSLAECSGAGTGGEPSREAATLRALLARLGGAS